MMTNPEPSYRAILPDKTYAQQAPKIHRFHTPTSWSTLCSLFFLWLFVSCSGKDDEEICTPPAVSHNLTGVWTASGTLFGQAVGPAPITFTQAGDVEGAAGLLGETGNALRTTWSVSGSNVLFLLDYGSDNTMEFVLPVLENECRKISLGEAEVLYIELVRN